MSCEKNVTFQLKVHEVTDVHLFLFRNIFVNHQNVKIIHHIFGV